MKLNREQWLQLSVGLTSFGIGAGVGIIVGHILTKRLTKPEPKDELEAAQLTFEFDDRTKIFNRQIQESNYIIKHFTESIQKLDNVIDQMQDTGEVYLGNFTEKFIKQEHNEEETDMNVIEQEDPPIENVFTGIDEDWNYDIEIPSRNPEIPYTCHRDEYFEEMEQNNLGHSHSTLTYYRGDSILCDELDSPIYDPERVVGKLEFGKGSQDPNVVYIRNEKLMADYEVLLDPGYYQVEVLGQQVENGLSKDDLKHSVQKFRFE